MGDKMKENKDAQSGEPVQLDKDQPEQPRPQHQPGQQPGGQRQPQQQPDQQQGGHQSEGGQKR